MMSEEEKQESSMKYLKLNASLHEGRKRNRIPEGLKPKFNISEIIKMYEHLGIISFTLSINDKFDLYFYEQYITELKVNGVRYEGIIYLGRNYSSYLSQWFNHAWTISDEDLDNFKRRNGFLFVTEIANISSVTFKVYLNSERF